MSFFVLAEITKNGYKPEWVFFLGLLSAILAIFTIVSKNPIHSVLYLIGLFVTIAVYLIVFNMTFLGISYLLVYVGAISILFLFILMLINIRVSELLTEGKNSAVLAVLVVIAFSFAFHNKLPYIMDIYQDTLNLFNKYIIATVPSESANLSTFLVNAELDHTVGVASRDWDSSLIEITHVSSIGNILYSVLYINMMIVAMILLLAMVGAIVVTVKPEDKSEEFNEPSSVSFGPNNPNYLNKSPFK